MQAGAFIASAWEEGRGEVFRHANPSSGAWIWEGREADAQQVDAAITAARLAFPAWSRTAPAERQVFLRAFADRIQQDREALADLISQTTGKPHWEALQEADLLPAKVDVSIAAQADRLATRELPMDGFRGVLRHRPQGVVAVLGPFNLPAHLPHSHLIPALLAGNTVVFKPSEFAPQVGAFLMRQWQAAGLPSGVLNLIQGGRAVGASLANHAGLDGLFFTGSYRAGLALNRLFADKPGKILALELGGNNPLVIWDAENQETAVLLTLQSAFLTAGQRCVSARRLILPAGGEGDALIGSLLQWTQALQHGFPSDKPEPFYGPVIHARAASDLLATQEDWEKAGAKPLLRMQASDRGPCLLSPGIWDVTEAGALPDEEAFGPLLQIVRVPDFDAAIVAANATSYGLSAGLISRQSELWNRFVTEVRAGVVNWNRPLTGASAKLPFGGVGRSGNHRPSAYAAADYCSYPVASLEAERMSAGNLLPGLIRPG